MRWLKPCGTQAAYRRHLRNGERTCDACRKANAKSVALAATGGWKYRDRGKLAHFWAKVALPDENGCMLWLGRLTGRQGYGETSILGQQGLAHRFSLLIAEGSPPDEERTLAAHSCRNKHCVAPAHLRWATSAENTADMLRDGTQVFGERTNSVKLTAEQVLDIRQRLEAGSHSRRELAREFGVVDSTIHNIQTRRTWGHLEQSTS